MRIVHFIHSDGAGGGPKVVRQLLSGLPSEEFHQSLIHGGCGNLAAWCRNNGIEARQVPTTSLVSAIFRIGSVVRAFRDFAPDIAILHGQWGGPIGALACDRAGVPARIYVAHCPAFYHSTSLFRTIRNHIAEKIPCSHCDRVVTLSDGNFYNYLYRGWADETKLVKIHNGIDPDEIQHECPKGAVSPSLGQVSEADAALGLHDLLSCPEGAPSLPFPPNSRNAIFVGRIYDQKRVDWLLHAWKSTSPHANWHLWIVGEGKERAQSEVLAKTLEIQSSVHFVGEQSNALEWIAAADLLVLSSLYEGHALVPLEAMAASKPVVAFATDGVTDSVVHEETGLLAPVGDTATLGKHIARLLSSSEDAQRMGRAGRQHLLVQFPLSKTLAQYESLIREVKNITPVKHMSER